MMFLPPLTAAELAALHSRLIIPVDDAIFRIEGSGTFNCLQGLLTNDVMKLASGSAAWGAFLTPKGMIVSDAWVIRDGDAAWVLAPGSALDTMRQLFARTMPPRLAKVTDRTGAMQLRWLCGGTSSTIEGATIAPPEGLAPFTALLLTADAEVIDARLIEQGWSTAPHSRADAFKLLMGWPTLGREIDDRTLPQEVRFDELGGVKYDKGCYTGQETVARLHFRGHANRALRGLRWGAGENPVDANVTSGEKAVGTLRTVARLGDQFHALAILRREVGVGEMVRAGGRDAIVIEPPFNPGGASVA